MAEELDWPAVLAELRKSVPPTHIDTWFDRVELLTWSPLAVTLKTPSPTVSQFLNENYADIVKTAIYRLYRFYPTVTFSDSSPPPPAVSTVRDHLGGQVRLNRQYTFDNFVSGPSNQLAYAASVAVAEAPGITYNPLFIHGAVGLGKSHLLQAICHQIIAQPRPVNILYLSCEDFVNQFIRAVEEGKLEEFRYRFRGVDVLAIDDIHFLANKERTQEEFFHTFNTLYNAQKQIILSSDSPPEEIPTLGERLVSRFKWGMEAEIEKPPFETRVAILKRKARLLNAEIDDEVAHLLANHIVRNIRELEGAIHKVIAYAALTNEIITPDLVRRIIRDLTPKPQLRIEDIQSSVCRRFNVKRSDLVSKKQSKSISFPRQVCIFLVRRLTSLSLKEIGAFFGGRDHSTCLYAEEQVKRKMEACEETRNLIDGLLRSIEKQA